MKNHLNLIKGLAASMIVATFSGLIGCQPDEFGVGNGLVDKQVPDLQFSVTKLEDRTNTYVLKTDKYGPFGTLLWDNGTGGGYTFGTLTDTVYYPDADTYTVALAVTGKGGKMYTKTDEIVVDASDPVAGNLVLGGKMNDGDDQYWTVNPISAGVSWGLADGKMTALGGGWGHQAIYQAIEVEANKKYRVDMSVSGSGATDTWFEVYVGTTPPTANSDYSDGGIRLGLNTWAGCGKTAFDGKLSALACSGTGGGVVQFANSGTVYLFIKTGGANLGTTGISIDNVEFRGVPEN